MQTKHPSYVKASSVAHAVQLATEYANSMFVAGGTDVYVNSQQGNVEASWLIDVSDLTDLQSCSIHSGNMTLGSMMTLSDVIAHNDIQRYLPALQQAAQSVATPVIRKTATLGGNILCENRCFYYNQSEWWRESAGHCLKCHGDICFATGGRKNCFSKFVSDTAPVLIAYGASVTLISDQGEECFPLENLYSGDGVSSVSLSRKSLLTSVNIPLSTRVVVFRKLRPRKSLDFTSLTTAVSLDANGNLRIVIGGVDPKPVVVEGNLRSTNPELLITMACKKPRVVENDFYSRPYRKSMIKLFIEDSIQHLVERQ